MGVSCVVTSVVGRSSASLPGCRTTVAFWSGSITNSATTWALFNLARSSSSSVAIFEMCSSYHQPHGSGVIAIQHWVDHTLRQCGVVAVAHFVYTQRQTNKLDEFPIRQRRDFLCQYSPHRFDPSAARGAQRGNAATGKTTGIVGGKALAQAGNR